MRSAQRWDFLYHMIAVVREEHSERVKLQMDTHERSSRSSGDKTAVSHSHTVRVSKISLSLFVCSDCVSCVTEMSPSADDSVPSGDWNHREEERQWECWRLGLVWSQCGSAVGLSCLAHFLKSRVNIYYSFVPPVKLAFYIKLCKWSSPGSCTTIHCLQCAVWSECHLCWNNPLMTWRLFRPDEDVYHKVVCAVYGLYSICSVEDVVCSVSTVEEVDLIGGKSRDLWPIPWSCCVRTVFLHECTSVSCHLNIHRISFIPINTTWSIHISIFLT